MKVLIIEDDQGLRQGIAFSLAQEGYEVLQAQNGKEGYRLFLQEAPQGILLDLNLPDMDGNDLCRRIRERSQVPILMLTARDMETDEIMGLSSGADDYMTKPFSVAVLELRLEKLLGRSDRRTAPARREHNPRPERASLQPHHRNHPLQRDRQRRASLLRRRLHGARARRAGRV